VERCAARAGAAAADAARDKKNKYKHTLRPEQYLQPLAFESEGYTSPEAQQLLLVGQAVGGEAERVSRGCEAPVLRMELRAGTPARQVYGALHHGARAAIIRGGGQQGQDQC
jgi:hypothetical protein